MPISFEYIEKGGVLLRGSGVLTDEDILEVNRAIYATPDMIKNIRYQIGDYTQVESIEGLTSQGIQKISKQDQRAAKINPTMLIAIAAEVTVVLGMARMWESYTGYSGLQTNVFKTVEECYEWINTPDL